jgi:hypothetical protein
MSATEGASEGANESEVELENVFENTDEPEPELDKESSNHGFPIDSELPNDFLQFQTWLQSPDGGRKCEKSAKQHAHQMGVILEAVDDNVNKSVSSLWSKTKLTKFVTVDVLDKEFMPGIVKSYLSSVRHWHSYILAEERDRLGSEACQQIQHMSDRMSRWITSYRKESAARSLEKTDQDIGKLITPEKAAAFDRSDVALEAIKCLGAMTNESNDVSMTDYVGTRDFLMTQVILTNACRSGVLANVTVQEFQQVRKIDNNYVISVVNHKTAFMYGPAKLVLAPSLFN